jgi:hypothetical protein
MIEGCSDEDCTICLCGICVVVVMFDVEAAVGFSMSFSVFLGESFSDLG